MPVFFQHLASDVRLLVWTAEEEESFFLDALPETVLVNLPAHPAKRKQFLAGRFLLKQLHPDFPFDKLKVTDSGRPHLSDEQLQFSLSHAGQSIAAITHPKRPVGIDVEKISERAFRVRHRFLSQREQILLDAIKGDTDPSDRIRHSTLAWSVKEAAFKALHQTGVDFIRDLPIESIHPAEEEWYVRVGEKGSCLEVKAKVIGAISLAWAVREVES